MKHAITWFEIPATDLDRAAKFYETIFQVNLEAMEMPGSSMRMFPLDDAMEGIGGAIVKAGDDFYQPSDKAGPLIYLNANPDLQLVLDRVEAAGGRVLQPKMEIGPEYGYMGILVDTEGNRIALHSAPENCSN